MNIFILDNDIKKCAEYHVDKHIVKMPLELAQLLCTALHFYNIDAPYKLTHINHPCSKWVRCSTKNFEYVVELGLALCKEYTYRYNKTHKCEAVINYCKSKIDELKIKLKINTLTYPALAMEDKYKLQDPVQAYRNYYNNAKQHLFKWKNREIPYWIKEEK